MVRYWFLPALAAGCILAVCAGCTETGKSGRAKLAPQGIAPDDVALHPNPNAPYLLPGSETPHLIARATALDAEKAGPCDPDVLSVEEISGDTNGVFRSVKLAFMNRGAAPCRLGGYPGVALVNSDGENIGTVSMEKVNSAVVMAELSDTHTAPLSGPAPAVTLMPHAVAAFQVAWTAGPECARVSRILVTAPGTRRSFSINQPLRICTGRIQVTELRLDEGNA
ncbi:MAG TPA: DUF4232 domain-containing protein [Acidobacteriaceae bacterium]|jgi:hypothetical protein|nr:DUF4232 domain-containing protein [Acidobacteriaceae bacterium]